MTMESLDIMLRLWDGRAAALRRRVLERPAAGRRSFDFLPVPPAPVPGSRTPPIGIAGLSPGSETLKLAGEPRLPCPLSISAPIPANTASHWRSVEEGAARSGRTPDRGDWRLVREVYVAPSDARGEAPRARGRNGALLARYLLPFYVGSGMGPKLQARRVRLPNDVLDVDYPDRSPTGSSARPSTVVDKIGAAPARHRRLSATMLIMIYDFSTEQEWWDESLPASSSKRCCRRSRGEPAAASGRARGSAFALLAPMPSELRPLLRPLAAAPGQWRRRAAALAAGLPASLVGRRGRSPASAHAPRRAGRRAAARIGRRFDHLVVVGVAGGSGRASRSATSSWPEQVLDLGERRSLPTAPPGRRRRPRGVLATGDALAREPAEGRRAARTRAVPVAVDMETGGGSPRVW